VLGFSSEFGFSQDKSCVYCASLSLCDFVISVVVLFQLKFFSV
jgi:hypothetical protein